MDDLNIKKLHNLLSRDELAESDVVQMLVLIRKVLEKFNLKKRYSVLNLYCNWTVHPALSQSTDCVLVLDQLTDILMRNTSGTNDLEGRDFIENLHKEVNDALGIYRFKKQIDEFCYEFNLPALKNWKKAFYLIAYNLADQPIEFPSVNQLENKRFRAIKAIYKSVQEKSGKNPKKTVIKFSYGIVSDNEHQRVMQYAPYLRPGLVIWRILVQENVTIQSLLDLGV